MPGEKRRFQALLEVDPRGRVLGVAALRTIQAHTVPAADMRRIIPQFPLTNGVPTSVLVGPVVHLAREELLPAILAEGIRPGGDKEGWKRVVHLLPYPQGFSPPGDGR